MKSGEYLTDRAGQPGGVVVKSAGRRKTDYRVDVHAFAHYPFLRGVRVREPQWAHVFRQWEHGDFVPSREHEQIRVVRGVQVETEQTLSRGRGFCGTTGICRSFLCVFPQQVVEAVPGT